jgi:hypothetical protein
MPDSQQPSFWGPAYHERDLDALLSGAAENIPPALHPVGRTLAALRAAPAGRELSAEAAARAAFRARMAPPAPPGPWTAAPEYEAVPADTLVLPLGEHLLPPPDRRPPRAARHRRRRATRSARGSAIALTSVAAVAVIAIAVALTGAIPGSIGQVMSFGGHPSQAAASSSSAARTESPRQSLDGNGTARPTASATVTGNPSVSPSASTTPDTLCREFYGSFEPSRHRNRATARTLFQQLASRAGGPDKVFTYCFRILGSSWFKAQRPYPAISFGGYLGGPGDRGRGHPGTGNTGTGSTGTGNPDTGGNTASTSDGQGQRGDAGPGGESRLEASPRVRAPRGPG